MSFLSLLLKKAPSAVIFGCRNPYGKRLLKLTALFVCAHFTLGTIIPPQTIAQNVLNLPPPGAMIAPSSAYIPLYLKGLKVYSQEPFRFDFVVDTGDLFTENEERKPKAEQEAVVKTQSQKLIKYFLAALTIPEDELWVNLSPYEADRITPEAFGQTQMGRDLLEQDYLLKQLTASLIYPEDRLGKEFWERVYQQAYERYGTTDIPMDTFHKVWIVPEKATVYQHGSTAFVMEGRLKVMLEEDYVAREKNMENVSAPLALRHEPKDGEQRRKAQSPEHLAEVSPLSSEILRELILPQIEKEVNEGQHFAQLRQIYHSMILATWFKQRLRKSLLGQIYVDQHKINGVDIAEKDIKEKIYQQYVEAYRKGVYNYIKEEEESFAGTKRVVPRKYFSGGVDLAMLSPTPIVEAGRPAAPVPFSVTSQPTDAAMLAPQGTLLELRTALPVVSGISSSRTPEPFRDSGSSADEAMIGTTAVQQALSTLQSIAQQLVEANTHQLRDPSQGDSRRKRAQELMDEGWGIQGNNQEQQTALFNILEIILNYFKSDEFLGTLYSRDLGMQPGIGIVSLANRFLLMEVERDQGFAVRIKTNKNWPPNPEAPGRFYHMLAYFIEGLLTTALEQKDPPVFLQRLSKLDDIWDRSDFTRIEGDGILPVLARYAPQETDNLWVINDVRPVPMAVLRPLIQAAPWSWVLFREEQTGFIFLVNRPVVRGDEVVTILAMADADQTIDFVSQAGERSEKSIKDLIPLLSRDGRNVLRLDPGDLRRYQTRELTDTSRFLFKGRAIVVAEEDSPPMDFFDLATPSIVWRRITAGRAMTAVITAVGNHIWVGQGENRTLEKRQLTFTEMAGGLPFQEVWVSRISGEIVGILKEGNDKALLSARDSSGVPLPHGGIDLDSEMMDFAVQGQGEPVHFSFQDQSCLETTEATEDCQSFLEEVAAYKDSFQGFAEIRILTVKELAAEDLSVFLGLASVEQTSVESAKAI